MPYTFNSTPRIVITAISTMTEFRGQTPNACRPAAVHLNGNITFAADYPGIGKKGEKVAAYSDCRWIADGKILECDSFGGQGTSKGLYWWDASAKVVKSLWIDSGGNWDMGTAKKQSSKITFDTPQAGSLWS